MPLRETTFIERNVESWRRLETELSKAVPDPDVVSSLYASISDDLSYARTHYPNRSVRSYLNHKAADISLSLYRNRKSKLGFQKFWLETLPLELYVQRAPLLLALGIFVLCFLIGWISGVVEPTFLERVVGPEYVSQTIKNIENGDPMAVYKDGSMLGGTLGIAGNNLYVAMLCFVSGIFAGIGTLFVLLRNAIMVGSFQQFFFGHGAGWESVLGIWTHGTIEISSIIVAAGAGFVLAKGVIWPGTLSRARAFQVTALSGLRIMAAIAPLIVLAAIIEGYLTRLTDITTAARVAFLLVNLAFVVYYFIVRPYQVGRKVAREPLDFGKLPPDRPLAWDPYQALSAGQVFFDSLRFFSKKGASFVGYVFLFSIGLALVQLLFFNDAYLDDLSLTEGGYLPELTLLMRGLTPGGFLSVALVVGLGFPMLTYKLHQFLPGGVVEGKKPMVTILNLSLPWLVLLAILFFHAFLALPFLPFLALWMRGISYETARPGKALSSSLQFGFGGFGRVLLTFIIFFFGSLLFMGAFYLSWEQFIYPFIAINIPAEAFDLYPIEYLISTAFDLFTPGLIVLVWVMGYGLLYHSLRENLLAEGLRMRLEKILPV